jgi:hypothetical protein
MKLSDIKVDSARIESREGEWVDEIPELPGIRIKARAANNADYRLLESKLAREIPQAQRLKGISPADQDRIAGRLLLETIVCDVDGLTNDDGSPMLYTKEVGKTLLLNPDFRMFQAAAALAAAIVAQRAKQNEALEVKN